MVDLLADVSLLEGVVCIRGDYEVGQYHDYVEDQKRHVQLEAVVDFPIGCVDIFIADYQAGDAP